MISPDILSLARQALEKSAGEWTVGDCLAARTREPQLANAVVELSEQLAEQKHHSDAFDARIESIVNGLSAADRAIREAERDSLRAELAATQEALTEALDMAAMNSGEPGVSLNRISKLRDVLKLGAET